MSATAPSAPSTLTFAVALFARSRSHLEGVLERDDVHIREEYAVAQLQELAKQLELEPADGVVQPHVRLRRRDLRTMAGAALEAILVTNGTAMRWARYVAQ